MKTTRQVCIKKLTAFVLAAALVFTSCPLSLLAETNDAASSAFDTAVSPEPAPAAENGGVTDEAAPIDEGMTAEAVATSNPDHLTGGEVPDGRLQASRPLRAPQTRGSSAPQWVQDLIQQDIAGDLKEDGSVKAYKPVIEEDPNVANKWTVKMLVAARDSVKTSRIVLVIDTSGSMNKAGRMQAAKDAANAFVDNVLDGSNTTQIGIVRFAGNVSIQSEFTNDKDKLYDAINGLEADGGTFTQAGVRQAKEMLSQAGADKKYMVVLSDGVPTYSYQLDNPDTYLVPGGPEPDQNQKETGTNMRETAFRYQANPVGTGRSMW